MKKTYNFIYLTTNLINEKQYIGDHSTNNIDDGYLGSGHPYFRNAVKEYGKENFKREILEFFDTKEEAFDAQEKYIKQYNTLVPNGYNISPKGGIKCIGSVAKETKERISKSLKGKNVGKKHSLKQNKEHSLKMIGKKHSEETKEKIRQKHKNKKFSEEHRKKLSLAAKNRKYEPLSEEHKKKISDSEKGRIHSNESNNKRSISNKGKKLTNEHKRKIQLSAIGRKLSDETKLKISKGNKNKIVSEETKQKMRKPKSEIHKQNIKNNHSKNKTIYE